MANFEDKSSLINKFCNSYRIPKKGRDNATRTTNTNASTSGNKPMIEENTSNPATAEYSNNNNPNLNKNKNDQTNSNKQDKDHTRPDRKCTVCNDELKVKGYKGVILCRGCFVFYARIDAGRRPLPTTGCVKGDNRCIIGQETRDRCNYCRLQKLYAAGLQTLGRRDETSRQKLCKPKSRPDDSQRREDRTAHRSPTAKRRAPIKLIIKRRKSTTVDGHKQAREACGLCSICGNYEVLTVYRDTLTCKHCREFSIIHRDPDTILSKGCLTGRNDCLDKDNTDEPRPGRKCQYCLIMKCIELGTIEQWSNTEGSLPRMTRGFVRLVSGDSTPDQAKAPYKLSDFFSDHGDDDDDHDDCDDTKRNSEEHRQSVATIYRDKFCEVCEKIPAAYHDGDLFLCKACGSFHWRYFRKCTPFIKKCTVGLKKCLLTEEFKCSYCRWKKMKRLIKKKGRSPTLAKSTAVAPIDSQTMIAHTNQEKGKRKTSLGESILAPVNETNCETCDGTKHSRYHKAVSDGSRIVLIRCPSDNNLAQEKTASLLLDEACDDLMCTQTTPDDIVASPSSSSELIPPLEPSVGLLPDATTVCGQPNADSAPEREPPQTVFSEVSSSGDTSVIKFGQVDAYRNTQVSVFEEDDDDDDDDDDEDEEDELCSNSPSSDSRFDGDHHSFFDTTAKPRPGTVTHKRAEHERPLAMRELPPVKMDLLPTARWDFGLDLALSSRDDSLLKFSREDEGSHRPVRAISSFAYDIIHDSSHMFKNLTISLREHLTIIDSSQLMTAATATTAEPIPNTPTLRHPHSLIEASEDCDDIDQAMELDCDILSN